jgi:hypothetical protein
MRSNSKMFASDSGRDGMLFSTLFIGAVLAITSVLYAVDVATVRALFSLP